MSSQVDAKSPTKSELAPKPEHSVKPERALTARGKDRRDALMAFASSKFAENGYHPTAVSEIVDGVGVGKGVFYWYFKSKDQLLREILRDALLDLRRVQMAAIQPAGDPLGCLELGLRATLKWSVDHPDVIRLGMFAWTEESFAHDMRKGRLVVISDTSKHIQRAMDLGLIQDGDARVLAAAMRGVSEELGQQAAISGEPLDAKVIDTAMRFCLKGLLGDTR